MGILLLSLVYDLLLHADPNFACFLQGKIKEDIIYGVCLPATGFSALFVLLALMTVVSVIVSGFICYHRQLAKVAEEAAPEPASARGATLPQIPQVPLSAVQTSFLLKEWNFNTWFRRKNGIQHGAHPPIYRQ